MADPSTTLAARGRRSRPRLLAVLSAAALAATGCASVDESLAPAELPEIDPSVQVSTLWRHDVGASAGKRRVRLHPAADGGRVFAADRKGNVSAFDVRTGERLWRTDVDVEIAAGPGTGEGLVLVGSREGVVIALSADTGREMWRRRLSSEVLSPPAASSGVVVARTQDGRIAALSTRDGTRIWSYDRSVPALSLRGTSTPALAGSAVVAGFDNGLLVALALDDGQLLWESRIAVPHGRSELERLVDIDADPLVVDDTVYVATYQGHVAAVDLYSGRTLWRREMSSHTGLGVSGRTLFVTDDQSQVWALDRESSASVWRQDKLLRRRLTPPVAFEGHVLVGDFEGYLHILSGDDGRLSGRVAVDGDGLEVAPIVWQDVILVYGRGGTLAALTTAAP